MKLFQLLFLGCCLMIFVQCKEEIETPTVTTLCNDDPIVTLSIEFTSITLEFPSCFDVMTLQGIDSNYGQIESTSENVVIAYDIGFLAGEYVSESSLSQTTVQGLHEEFRYEVKDSILIFTFPAAGPANFYTEQLEHEADLIELFKSLAIN